MRIPWSLGPVSYGVVGIGWPSGVVTGGTVCLWFRLVSSCMRETPTATRIKILMAVRTVWVWFISSRDDLVYIMMNDSI